jgi:hypothetical protein
VTMTDDDGMRRLWQVAQASAVSPNVLSAWLGPPPEPAPGQIWRARWGEVAEAILLLDVKENAVETVPVTFDDEEADAGAGILTESDSSLGTSVVLWLDISNVLPMRVLERCLGSVDPRVSSRRQLGATVGELPRGEAVVYASDPRREVRAELEDRLEELSHAEWIGAGSGDLGVILAGHGLTPSGLAARLNVPVPRAMSILRGQAAVTEEEAERLADVTGRSASDLLASNPVPPAGIVLLLDQPSRRSQVLMFAAKRGIPEVEARRRAAFGTWALAARQTGESLAPEWSSRLDRYFEVVLGE